MFPNQDTLPKGGFGNLIALPLQKTARERGASVFVDDELYPHADQWVFLASVQPMPQHDIEPAILRATGGSHPLDVTFATEEDLHEPWKRKPAGKQRLAGPMPASLTLTLANLIYVEKAPLPQTLANRLIRLAAFANPEFHQAQALRLPVWNKPRLIGCAENFPRHIALPRGCLDAVRALHVALRDRVLSLFILHGRLSRTQRTRVVGELDALDAEAPRVLLATGRLVGEGFDHPPLDTLVLAMPISWKGTLQQYAGRLHREHVGKHHIRIIDFIDTDHPSLLRMWERQQRGYQAMGYREVVNEMLDLESPTQAML